jgi:hypothetical protein
LNGKAQKLISASILILTAVLVHLAAPKVISIRAEKLIFVELIGWLFAQIVFA